MEKTEKYSEEMPADNLDTNASRRRKCTWPRKVLFVILGLWVVVILALQFILNSKVLTRIADRFAREYIEGTVSFSGIEASMFRSFPNLNVCIEDFSITYPHERFAEFDSIASIDNPIINMGCGESADTLVHFDKLSAGVNYISAIFGKIRIRRAELERPRIFAKQYGPDMANWNMFRFSTEEDDTSAFTIPSVSVGRISLTGQPIAAYSNPKDTLFGGIFIKQVDLAGQYTAGSRTLSDLSVGVDSLFVAGRLPSDTLLFALDHLEMNEEGEGFDLDLKSELHLLMQSAGRMVIPFEAKGMIVPELKDDAVSVKDLNLCLATLDILGEGRFDWSDGKNLVQAKLLIDKEPVREITEYFGRNFSVLKELETDARISMEAVCDGYMTEENGMIPPLSVRITVPKSTLLWKSLDERGTFSMDAKAYCENGGLAAEVSGIKLSINGLDVDLKGGAKDLTEGDPLISLDGDVRAVLDSLVRFIPDSLGIKAAGRMEGFLKGGIRLSQLSAYNFSDSNLEGNITSDGVRIQYPKDTISAFLGRAAITVGKSADSHSQGRTGISASIDSLFAEYGASTYFAGTGISLSAHNSPELISKKDHKHPVNVSLDISSLGMMDLDSCFVGVKESCSSFKFSQTEKEGFVIPYLSLSSANETVSVRQGVNRFSLKDAVFSAQAHPNSYETDARRKHIQDSLRRIYPGIPRDSLFMKAFGRLARTPLPDFLSEKDFEKRDIDIRLSESMAEYVRDWDLTGGLKIGEASVISPYFPLENRLSDVNCSFNNNQVKLSEVRLTSGSSDISANGVLSGLRRSLTGKGRLSLDLGINSDFIDADEILLALNAGRNFVEPGHNVALSEVDDKDYLVAVQEETVVDSTGADDLLVLPANLNVRLSLQANTVKYSNLEASWVSSDIEMKERCLQIANTLAMTNMGDVYLEGFYSTRTKEDLKAGFDLMLSNITAEKVIELFPVVDSIMPMLQSVRGLLDCEIAATTSIDTTMSIVAPTLSGILKVDGKNLSLADGEEMNKLRKTLMFKDKDSSTIDNMSVRGIIKDNRLEIFPFVLKVDRYHLAASGLQNFDQNFKYHVSALRSPIPFRFGVNLRGSFEDWKWKLAKAKYKNAAVPVFDDQVDELRFSLINSIHNIFDRGVEQAIESNQKAQEAIEEKKTELSYSVEAQADTLSAVELKTLELFEKLAGEGVIQGEETESAGANEEEASETNGGQ